MTYSQKAGQTNSSLRKLRRVFRAGDTSGEKLERELDRLILRKTLVESQSLQKTLALLQAYTKNVSLLVEAFNQVVVISTA